MRLVVDTNILFSAFWKDSFTRKLLFSGIELFAPLYALEELNQHEQEIRKKANISLMQFRQYRKELAMAVVFVPFKEYSDHIKHFNNDDADFLALAMKLNIPLWSNDSALKKEKVVVISTMELAATKF